MIDRTYPFSAIVGQEGMKTALLLNAVDPGIGGVLIRGQKGTAKSTAARALAALLPDIEAVEGCPYHCPLDQPEQMCASCLKNRQKQVEQATVRMATPMVELPLGATEDRVVGSVHLEQTLRHGHRVFEEGLLAAANRGILYVDEVNLLEDHLVDLLLDAAASGVNRVEREGLQIVHPARFMLIGTMNPEEGELRPQFLDRFGLTVAVEGLESAAQRQELIRRRLDFERHPQSFYADWADQESFLRGQVDEARRQLQRVEVTDAALDLAVNLALELKVQGHRADMALLKAARALAALMGRENVSPAEVREVAWFVLPHRLPGGVLLDESEIRKTLEPLLIPDAAPADTADEDPVAAFDDPLDSFEFPGSAAAGSLLFETFKKKLQSV